jgi:hypothetical protein
MRLVTLAGNTTWYLPSVATPTLSPSGLSSPKPRSAMSINVQRIYAKPILQGRKLEEMDDIFKHSSWFVPTAKFTPVSATQRENEMRAGELFRALMYGQ